jgi:hypothetical protein
MSNLHLHFIFQMLVMSAIVLVLWQIKTADRLDRIRHDHLDRLFWWRRATMFLKLLTLCWTVVYSYSNGWAPWPPIVGFLAAFDLHVVTQTFIMRQDIARLERMRPFQDRQTTQ